MKTYAEYYSQSDQISVFGGTYLEWPEIMLLHEVADHDTEMLDLGIGSGRTTLFFIPVVRRYVGVDIAPGMVEGCRQRFSGLGLPANAELSVADATALGDFADESFDVVLFSFNGVDCIPENFRNDCFSSVRRVLRRGGRFVFTSHNLMYVENYYQFQWSINPRGILKELTRLRMIKKINGPVRKVLERDMTSFWDGAYFDQPDLKHVYIRPDHQIVELKRLGFTDVKAYAKVNGQLLDKENSALTRDPWVYYFCRRSD